MKALPGQRLRAGTAAVTTEIRVKTLSVRHYVGERCRILVLLQFRFVVLQCRFLVLQCRFVVLQCRFLVLQFRAGKSRGMFLSRPGHTSPIEL